MCFFDIVAVKYARRARLVFSHISMKYARGSRNEMWKESGNEIGSERGRGERKNFNLSEMIGYANNWSSVSKIFSLHLSPHSSAFPSFIAQFIHSFTHLCIHSLIHSLTYSFIHLLTCHSRGNEVIRRHQPPFHCSMFSSSCCCWFACVERILVNSQNVGL